jgi:hypothetical protein
LQSVRETLEEQQIPIYFAAVAAGARGRVGPDPKEDHGEPALDSDSGLSGALAGRCRGRSISLSGSYCRGPYCVLSYEAMALLRERGFRVRRLVDGLPEWRSAGLPVEVG